MQRRYRVTARVLFDIDIDAEDETDAIEKAEEILFEHWDTLHVNDIWAEKVRDEDGP